MRDIVSLHWGMMTRRALKLLPLCLFVLLPGCLFTINQPMVAPDGTIAVFLEADGNYSLFPDGGMLHLFRDGSWIPVPGAVLSETGSLLDVSVDGAELLYADVSSGELFDPMTSSLYRVSTEPEAIPVLLLETEWLLAKAAWTVEGDILLLFFGDDDLGTLERYDRATGDLELLHGNLLSFEYHPKDGTIDLLGVDQDGDLTAGYVERWDPETNRRPELGLFVCSQATIELFPMLPHSLLWDVSPDGLWIALSLYDATMLEPLSDHETPDLYLIDTAFETVERIAVGAVMPAFSPGGEALAYLVTETDSNEDAVAVAIVRDLSRGAKRVVPGSLGASTICWLGPNRLGMTFEDDDDRAWLVEIDLTTDETVERIAAPVAPPAE